MRDEHVPQRRADPPSGGRGLTSRGSCGNRCRCRSHAEANAKAHRLRVDDGHGNRRLACGELGRAGSSRDAGVEVDREDHRSHRIVPVPLECNAILLKTSPSSQPVRND